MSRAMKNSGIPWIGEIPSHWRIIPFKEAVLTITTGLNPRDNFVLSKDAPYYYITIRNFKDGKLYLDENCDRINENAWEIIQKRSCLQKGDILFASISKDAQCYILQDFPYSWNINESVFALRGNNSLVINEFLYYSLVNPEYYKALRIDATGTTFQSIKQNKLKESVFVLPPISEQQSIVDFLNIKCGEIDEMISLQERIVDELKAYKQSIISEAVSRGLNPNVRMKDSGIEWVKHIPSHWKLITPKALFSQRKEKAEEGERQLTASQQYGVIYQDEYTEITGSKVVSVMKDFDILKHVERGDFVISMRSFQGGLEYSTKTGSISSAYVMLIPNLKYVFPRYYRWLFKSVGYINALQSTSNMVRDGQAMRYSNFAQVPLYTVPLREQEDIADYLDDKCGELEALISIKQSKIEALKEYKKSIIYEYITGKKETPCVSIEE